MIVAAFPLNVGVETLPDAVNVCECVPSAEPVKVSAGTVPADPVKVSAGTVPPLPAKEGTEAGHATVPAGVPAETAAVDPLKVAADTPEPDDVKSFTPLPEVASASVPAPCECVAIAEPLNVGTLAGHATVPDGVKLAVAFVPAGVKLTVPFVPAGVPALTAEVVWFAVPVKFG